MWFLRLLTWDGLLPAVVWSAPWVVQSLLPGRRGAVELTAIVLPISALLVRFPVGWRHIQANGCSIGARRWQTAALCLGILLLMFVDAVAILAHVMPPGAAVATVGDVVVWTVLYVLYLATMAFAMYPGHAIADVESAGMTP